MISILMVNNLKEIEKEYLEKTINILEFFDMLHYDIMRTIEEEENENNLNTEFLHLLLNDIVAVLQILNKYRNI